MNKIEITFSKAIGLLVIVLGTIIALVLDDPSAFEVGCIAGVSLIGAKTALVGWERRTAIRYKQKPQETID